MIVITRNIEDHLGLAATVALSYVRPGEPLEDSDVYADAMAGLAKAFNRIEKYNPTWEFSTWAMTIIKNHVMDGLRRKKKQTRIPMVRLNGDDFAKEEEEVIPTELLEIFLADHEEDSEANKRSKRILKQYYLEGLTWVEIGRRQNMSRGRAWQLGQAAIELIQVRFKDLIAKNN